MDIVRLILGIGDVKYLSPLYMYQLVQLGVPFTLKQGFNHMPYCFSLVICCIQMRFSGLMQPETHTASLSSVQSKRLRKQIVFEVCMFFS